MMRDLQNDVHLQSLCVAVGVDPDTTNSIMRTT
jgi:hypothetical protein